MFAVSSRQHVTQARTALINHCRGLLAEFGVVLPQDAEKLRKELPALLADENSGIPPMLHTLMQEHLEDLARMEQRVRAIDQQLKVWMSQHAEAERLEQIKGVGVITATAFVAGVVDAHLFKDSRQFAAWLGLVPKQYSSGGKSRLGCITKQGDVYLRTLLVQGARGIVYQAGKREDRFSGWIKALVARAGVNKTVIAVAAKQAREEKIGDRPQFFTEPALVGCNHTCTGLKPNTKLCFMKMRRNYDCALLPKRCMISNDDRF